MIRLFNTMFDKAQATPDVASRLPSRKPWGVYSIDNCLQYRLHQPDNVELLLAMGEELLRRNRAGNYGDITAFAKEIWIDQNLKTSLGY